MMLSPGLRVTPWRLDDRVAHLSLSTHRALPLPVDDLRQDLLCLHHHGYRGAVTAALPTRYQTPFEALGFGVIRRLHLLVRHTDRMPRRGAVRTRRARRAERAAVLDVDHAAFERFWQIDGSGLASALSATRATRFRVVRDRDGQPAGYAIFGRCAGHGYVQRLAVHPDHQGQGLGTALLLDGLRWLARWGAGDVEVNTQHGNERSLDLYTSMGFELQPDGLAVLRLDFEALR